MEYLVYAGFFVGGWVLAKVDRFRKGIPVAPKEMEKIVNTCFQQGANYGYQYRIEEENGNTPENKQQQFGFVSARKGKTND